MTNSDIAACLRILAQVANRGNDEGVSDWLWMNRISASMLYKAARRIQDEGK